jgi:hypothetical protein
MRTKSAIQLIAEALEAKDKFFSGLQSITEQYNVKNNVFCCGNKGQVEEPAEGYFGQVARCASLLEAQKDFNIFTQGIRICGDEIFVGNLYSSLDQVVESEIIDLEKGIMINS